MASGHLSTWTTVALFLVMSVAAVSSDVSPTRLRGPNVCGLRRDRCCRGWSVSVSRMCTIPVCASNRCMPGGTCIRPNICRCADGEVSRTCPSVVNRSKRMADGKTHVKPTKKNSFAGPCSSTACDHICEDLPDNSYRCSCREGYLLHANKRKCFRGTFTGWTGDRLSGISAPTNTGQTRDDTRHESSPVFQPPDAAGEWPKFLDSDLKYDRFKEVPYNLVPSLKHDDVVLPEKMLNLSFEPIDEIYINNSKVDPEELSGEIKKMTWFKADGKGDENSDTKESMMKPDKDIRIKDWEEDWTQGGEEKLTKNRKEKDLTNAKDVWEPKIYIKKPNLKVTDTTQRQNFNSEQRKYKYSPAEISAKLEEERKSSKVAHQLREKEKKYLEQIEWAKKEFENRENEKEENEKKEVEKLENKKKENKRKKKGKKENGKKELEKNEDKIEKVNKETGGKKYEKEEYNKYNTKNKENGKKVNGEKENGKDVRDDKARRRLVSLVHSPTFNNVMPTLEKYQKWGMLKTNKGPKGRAADKETAEKKRRVYLKNRRSHLDY